MRRCEKTRSCTSHHLVSHTTVFPYIPCSTFSRHAFDKFEAHSRNTRPCFRSPPRPPPPIPLGKRRVSSTANRARYSAGFSRFSLPSSLSPSRGDASIIEEDVDGSTPQEKARGVLEGLLTLAHPITGDEKELVGSPPRWNSLL